MLRHYLSLNNLNNEVEKWIQKIKPTTSEQWEEFVKKFDKAVLTQVSKNKVINTKADNSLVKATAAEEAETKLEKVEDKRQDGLSVGLDAKDITLEGLWQGIKLKTDLHFGKISQSSWKTNKPIVTKTSIHSRTAYVISAIVTAEKTECLMKRTEHFIDHLKQYPEARDYAIKEGAVRALLRVQNRLDEDTPLNKEVGGIVNEALALMGWVGLPRGPGPNILSLDGGGIRGLIAIEILRHLERITARPVHELFDFIIGVSTGAIIAAVIGSGIGNLETASGMYHTLSKEMFGNTSVIGGTSRLVWTHSYYDTEAWEKMLRENLRECSLTECNRYNTPKMALVSCVVNRGGGRPSPFVFRSYESGWRVRSALPGTSAAQVWQAVRASAAAPTYFHEYRLHGLLHQDGGIMVNNPTGVGVHEAKLLFGVEEVRRGTVVSVGTGKALHRHPHPHPHPRMQHMQHNQPSGATPADTAGTSWRDKFNKILDSATDTEGVHLVLNDMLPDGQYFRFNPPLMQECAIDEIDPHRLRDLSIDTQAYIRRNQHKFEQAAAMLTRKRGIAQRAMDLVHRNSLLMGLAQAK